MLQSALVQCAPPPSQLFWLQQLPPQELTSSLHPKVASPTYGALKPHSSPDVESALAPQTCIPALRGLSMVKERPWHETSQSWPVLAMPLFAVITASAQHRTTLGVSSWSQRGSIAAPSPP